MSENKILFLLIFSAFIIRICLSSLPGFQSDVYTWFAWSIRLNEVGFLNFYSPSYFSDYTPGYLYVLTFLGYIRNLFLLEDQIFFMLLKLPAIFCEIILGILIYKEVFKKSGNLFAILCSSLIFFNPAFIFNSAIWGQVDGVLSLFLFLTIYYLNKKEVILSSLFLGVAFLIKPQTIALFPLYLLFILKDFNILKVIKLSVPFLSLIFLLSLPFFLEKPFTGLINLVLDTAKQYNYTSLFAYNFWGIFGFWIPDGNIWNKLSYQHWGFLLFTGYWIILIYFYFKRKISIYSLAALAFLAFYFLPTKVHERYLYSGLVFLILISGILKSKLLLILTASLSFIHFLNLYYVYVYYNELHLNMSKILYNPFIYNFLQTNEKTLSLISTLLFIGISFVIIKLSYVSKKS